MKRSQLYYEIQTINVILNTVTHLYVSAQPVMHFSYTRTTFPLCTL